jgi:hypothetical protein
MLEFKNIAAKAPPTRILVACGSGLTRDYCGVGSQTGLLPGFCRRGFSRDWPGLEKAVAAQNIDVKSIAAKAPPTGPLAT